MIQIRDARKADASILGALSRSAFREGFDGDKIQKAVHDFAEETESDSYSVFTRYRVAEDEGAVVGMCGVYRLRWIGPQVRYLGWFFVDPNRQREGIGQALLKDSIGLAKELRARWLMVETDDEALDAQRLYKAHGFETVVTIPDYWPDREALVLMGLRLGS